MIRLAISLACVAVIAALLAGCGFTQQGDAARALVLDKGAQAYDEGLVNAETFVCSVASAGSVVRRYGKAKESWETWLRLCGYGARDLPAPDIE